MNASETRQSWTCDECSVTSRRPEIGATPMPTGWTAADDRLLCLACARREEGKFGPRLTKAELARRRSADRLREAREDREADARAALAARAPAQGGGPITEVAEETGHGEALVRDVRKKMRAAGELPPAERGAPRKRDPNAPSSNADRAKAALKSNPAGLDGEIAAEIGVPPRTVAQARKTLGLLPSREVAAGRTAAAVAGALRERGAVTAGEVANAVGITAQTAKTKLDALVAQGAAVAVHGGAATVFRHVAD